MANVIGNSNNWSGGTVGSGYLFRGHTDGDPNNSLEASGSDGYYGTGNSSGQTAEGSCTNCSGVTGNSQRRTLELSTGETIWDMAGNVFDRVDSTLQRSQHPQPGGWNQWNSSSLVLNGFSSLSTHSSMVSTVPGINSYTTSNGLGMFYSDYASGNSDQKSFVRGCGWADGFYAGVACLSLSASPTAVDGYIGFRVAYSP